MCTFRFHFWTGKSIEIRPSHVRASSVPNLCAFCLNKRSCIFVRTGRPLLLILRFCGLIFGTARRSQKWDRQIFGTVFRFIFVKFFASGLKKRKRIFVAYGDRKGNCTCCHDVFRKGFWETKPRKRKPGNTSSSKPQVLVLWFLECSM